MKWDANLTEAQREALDVAYGVLARVFGSDTSDTLAVLRAAFGAKPREAVGYVDESLFPYLNTDKSGSYQTRIWTAARNEDHSGMIRVRITELLE